MQHDVRPISLLSCTVACGLLLSTAASLSAQGPDLSSFKEAESSLATLARPGTQVFLEDFDEDGHLDLVGFSSRGSVVVLYNDGSGRFTDLTGFAAPALEPAPPGSTPSKASSTDFVGPCTGEQHAFGSPAYLSADGPNEDWAGILLTEPGRFKLGISCVSTSYAVVKIGPSALCSRLISQGYNSNVCSNAPAYANAIRRSDISAVAGGWNVPFTHSCTKHGFGWYDAVNVPAGSYMAVAVSEDVLQDVWEGHGTMDTYAFIGNNGNYQPVGCSSSGGGGGGGGGGDPDEDPTVEGGAE